MANLWQRLTGSGKRHQDGGPSVKTSLLLAFACVLAGALAIGAFSLWQMGRINASTQAIYEQEYAAAASQSLDEQVQRLEHLVARFSLQ